MEEEVSRVGKSASTGQLKAYIGDQWVNIANAEKTASGKYKITHLPKLAEETSSPQTPSLLDTTLSAKDLVAGKKQVEEEAKNLGEYDDSQDFVPGRMLKKMGKDIGVGLARTGMVEEKYRIQFKEFPKSKEPILVTITLASISNLYTVGGIFTAAYNELPSLKRAKYPP